MKLSNFELDVLQVIWKQAPCAAPDVHEQIQPQHQVTYSTVKTIIDRLEKKGALERCGQTGRTIFYRASVSPDSVQKPLLEQFLSRVFAGNLRPLFNQLLDEDHLSEDDLAYLEQLLAKRRERQEPSA